MTDEGIHHVMSDLVPVIVVVTMTITSAWVLSLIIKGFRQRTVLRAQTDFQNKMLEKFGTAEEFAVYLQSDAGKSFFDSLSKEPSAPLTKILCSIQKGAILTLLGIGFLLLSNFADLSVDGRIVQLVIATISATTGIGFLISSAISYRLAKTWGLISTNNAAIGAAATTAAQ